MNFESIIVETSGRITTITLNRPAAMNAIHAAMHDELQAAFDAFAADASQFVCVVTGAGACILARGACQRSAGMVRIRTALLRGRARRVEISFSEKPHRCGHKQKGVETMRKILIIGTALGLLMGTAARAEDLTFAVAGPLTGPLATRGRPTNSRANSSRVGQ